MHVADLEQVEQVVSAIPDSARELIRLLAGAAEPGAAASLRCRGK